MSKSLVISSLLLICNLGFMPVVRSAELTSLTPSCSTSVDPTQRRLAALSGSARRIITEYKDESSPFSHTENAPHKITVLDTGPAELELKLRLIAEAKVSIEINSYDFGVDNSGRAVLHALVEKCKSNPKFQARMVLDFLPEFGQAAVTPELATQLATQTGGRLQIRYYNPGHRLAFWKTQNRDHMKVFIKDGKELVTGGRNTSDHYYGLNDKQNYVDRGIWIRGPGVKAPHEVFQRFWAEAKPLEGSSRGIYRRRAFQAAPAIMSEILKGDPVFRARIKDLGERELNRSFTKTVNNVTFVADRPGGRPQDGREVTPFIMKDALSAQKRIWIDNYLFLPSHMTGQVLRAVDKDNVQVTVLSNSTKSGDQPTVQILAGMAQRGAAKSGRMQIWAWDGRAPAGQASYSKEAQAAHWTDHTKTQVVDNKVFIGSFNLDFRSQQISTETGIRIDDAELAEHIINRTIERINSNGLFVQRNGDYVTPDGHELREHSSFWKAADTAVRKPLLLLVDGMY